jgi:DNA repair protein RadC
MARTKEIEVISFRECRLILVGHPKKLRKPINGPRDFFYFLKKEMADRTQEMFLAVHLDARHVPLGYHMVSLGSASASIVHPREVYRPAILNGAVAVLLAHNHPSGNAKPSAEDVQTTTDMAAAGLILGVELLDHLVIVGDGYYSMKEEGYFKRPEKNA